MIIYVYILIYNIILYNIFRSCDLPWQPGRKLPQEAVENVTKAVEEEVGTRWEPDRAVSLSLYV